MIEYIIYTILLPFYTISVVFCFLVLFIILPYLLIKQAKEGIIELNDEQQPTPNEALLLTVMLIFVPGFNLISCINFLIYALQKMKFLKQ